MRKIKFSRCMTEPFKGEEWEKLQTIENGETVTLNGAGVVRMDEVDLDWWRDDTFREATADFIIRLMADIYRVPGRVIPEDTYLILLVFKRKNGEIFTTARGYDIGKYHYYRREIGNAYRVVKTYL